MKVQFYKIAQKEFDGSVEFYNKERAGLGDEFLNEVVGAIKRIKCFPQAWPVYYQDIRGCQLKRFPFRLVYRQRNNLLQIIAVANFHRAPFYWTKRLKS